MLTMIPLNPSGANEINFYQNGFGKPVWSSGVYTTPFEAYDIPGYYLTMKDGT